GAKRTRPLTARTMDSLFGPLPQVETRGRAWLFINKELKMVNLRLGISDGTFTEVINDTELQPDMDVVTSVVTAEMASRPANQQNQNNGNPLMPQRGRPGGPGGGGRGGGRETLRRAESMGGTGISVRDLTKTYQVGDIEVRALRGASLDVHRGEFVCVTGPSGSGKSTFMHIIGCLDRPTSGQYFLDGKDVSKLSKDDLAGIRNKKI